MFCKTIPKQTRNTRKNEKRTSGDKITKEENV